VLGRTSTAQLEFQAHRRPLFRASSNQKSRQANCTDAVDYRTVLIIIPDNPLCCSILLRLSSDLRTHRLVVGTGTRTVKTPRTDLHELLVISFSDSPAKSVVYLLKLSTYCCRHLQRIYPNAPSSVTIDRQSHQQHDGRLYVC